MRTLINNTFQNGIKFFVPDKMMKNKHVEIILRQPTNSVESTTIGPKTIQ